jgi:hypothetical protein
MDDGEGPVEVGRGLYAVVSGLTGPVSGEIRICGEGKKVES